MLPNIFSTEFHFWEIVMQPSVNNTTQQTYKHPPQNHNEKNKHMVNLSKRSASETNFKSSTQKKNSSPTDKKSKPVLLDAESTRLWRIRGSLLRMLEDQNYAVLADEKNMGLEEFIEQFVNGKRYKDHLAGRPFTRHNLNIISFIKKQPEEMVYIHFCNSNKINTEELRKISEMMGYNIHRTIVILPSTSLKTKQYDSIVLARQNIKTTFGSDYKMEVLTEDEVLKDHN